MQPSLPGATTGAPSRSLPPPSLVRRAARARWCAWATVGISEAADTVPQSKSDGDVLPPAGSDRLSP